MKQNYESGRSMVEMLGTLAIMGVLSIGGIMGYSYAVDKYRANATINDVNLRIVDLIAQANRGGDLSLSEWPTKSTVGYDIGLEKDATTSKNTGGIQVSSVPNRVCEFLGEMTDVSNITLKIMGTDYTKGSCGEENVMVFFQSDVVNGIGGTQPCNGPVVDGKCEACQYPFIYNGTDCTGCPEGYVYFNYSNGSCYNEETLEALCPENTVYVYVYGMTPYPICADCPDNAISCSNGIATCPEGTQFYAHCDKGYCATEEPDNRCY